MVVANNRETFMDQLQREIAGSVRPDEQERVNRFARLFFRSFPLEELHTRDMVSVAGILYACWSFLQDFEGGHARIKVFSPTLEADGWSSRRTVIQVLSRDMPFLVGSLMGELNRREVDIHSIHSTVVRTRRGEGGRLLDFKGRHAPAPDFAEESLVYLEISRNTDARFLADLTASISTLLDEVAVVVDNWAPMAEQGRAAYDELQQCAPQGAGSTAALEFLQWMVANHFTFLGYQTLELTGQATARRLQCRAGSALGLTSLGYGELGDDLLASLLAQQTAAPEQLICFGRYRFQSRVHRRVYPELILVWRYDHNHQLVGAHCFMGLFTSVVHTMSANSIPLINRRVANVLERTGYRASSHNGREIVRILETFPRGELFRITEDELFDVAVAIFNMRERRQVRLFMSVDAIFGFVSCLVYVPRALFNTRLRTRLQAIIGDAIRASDVGFSTFLSESVLARIHFLFRIEPGASVDVSVDELQQQLVSASKSWEEHLREALVEELGDEQGTCEAHEFLQGFPPGYQYECEPRVAVGDIRQIRSLSPQSQLGMSFYRSIKDASGALHFRLVREGEPLILSDVIPILEQFGLRVAKESAYNITSRSNVVYGVQEFVVQYGVLSDIRLDRVTENFKEAFRRIWDGDSESDAFNKLLLGAQLDWRQVAVLRAYARYMKQLAFQFSEAFIAETLCNHLHIAAELVEYFETRFSPLRALDEDQRAAAEEAVRAGILASLDAVDSLNEDRVIRHYLTLMGATLRTNFYQRGADGGPKSYMSFKIKTTAIEEAPLPRPAFEIFVYSPRLEGVHLRGGPVARGGLRWSDRYEDFRTEVLGLVKAQQVKNAIIVPVGAKGGFVCKREPYLNTREERAQEGLACYKTFIRGLLDITDNLKGMDVVPPRDVVRKDGDDPYLVVAADKGTATFSDTANAVSAEYDFWLGDAFASGGEFGYDHKKMGITARGAWVCVQRHFREMGIDIQSTPFTVVGIGDMGGDVFGNGMLLSEHIQLTAAFNHQHIFIDPNPEAAASYRERRRLFDLPRSSWADYSADLISAGGGVFPRSAKSIAISPQMQERFAIQETSLTPAGLIKALLKAPVDLLWNGGIGTYVKSRGESHADAGDKANDAVRINGNELRAKVVGEGGNLGMTQLGRVEYALSGGRVNTDFIDNAGGVDCSDYEVNIKILLNDRVAAGDLTVKQRNVLLEEMTDDVGGLVLKDNDSQARAISVAESRGERGIEEYLRFIQSITASGRLNRELEFIPDDDVLRDRRNKGKGFMRPELAVLSAYSKALLKDTLVDSSLPDEPYVGRILVGGFPPLIAERFGDELPSHRLRRQIIAMRVGGEMVNNGGITFAHRMRESTGASDDAIAKGYLFARDVFGVEALFKSIAQLDHKITAAVQYELMDRITNLLRGATRWFLRSRRQDLPLEGQVASYSNDVRTIWDNLKSFLEGSMASYWQDSFAAYTKEGVGDQLAAFVAGTPVLMSSLNVCEAAQLANMPVLDVARLFFRIGEALGLTRFSRQIYDSRVESHWQAIAREGLLDDLASDQKAITVAILQCQRAGMAGDACIDNWMEQRRPLVRRWQDALAELNAAPATEFAMYAVVLRELSNLARSEPLR